MGKKFSWVQKYLLSIASWKKSCSQLNPWMDALLSVWEGRACFSLVNWHSIQASKEVTLPCRVLWWASSLRTYPLLPAKALDKLCEMMLATAVVKKEKRKKKKEVCLLSPSLRNWTWNWHLLWYKMSNFWHPETCFVWTTQQMALINLST